MHRNLLHEHTTVGKSQALVRLLDSRRIGVDAIRDWSPEQVNPVAFVVHYVLKCLCFVLRSLAVRLLASLSWILRIICRVHRKYGYAMREVYSNITFRRHTTQTLSPV